MRIKYVILSLMAIGAIVYSWFLARAFYRLLMEYAQAMGGIS